MDNHLTPSRALLWAFGLVLLAVGGQPLVNYFSGDSSLKSFFPSLLVVVAGLFCIGLALLWKPNEGSRSATLFEGLGRLGSSPIPYAILALLMWGYFETLAVQRNIELAALRNDEHSITEALNRFVLPRQLTPEQIDTIGGFLQQFPPRDVNFLVVQGDEEASSYLMEFVRALQKGGWQVKSIDYSPSPPQELGLWLANPSAIDSNDQKNPEPKLQLEESLGLAGVRFDGVTGGAIPGLNNNGAVLTIGIGHRRRDSYALPCSPK
jgi:hypothetical protein